MIVCPKCSNLMVKSYMLNGDEFDYCRTCKKELSELQTTSTEKLSKISSTRTFHNMCAVINDDPSRLSKKVPLKYSIPLGAIVSFSVSNHSTGVCWELSPAIDIAFPPRIWVPYYHRPTSGDIFKGIDRSLDPTRLAGLTRDGVGSSIEETIVDTFALLNREGSKADAVFLNQNSFKELAHALKMPTDIVSLEYRSAYGRLQIYLDSDVMDDFGYFLQMDTWVRSDVFGTYCVSPGYNAVMRFK